MDGEVARLLESALLFHGADSSDIPTNLESNLKAFLQRQETPDGSLLGEFRCSTAHLELLGEALLASPRKSKLAVCASGEGAATPWDEARLRDAARLNAFQAKYEAVAEVMTYSVPLGPASNLKERFLELGGFSAVNVEVVVEAGFEDLDEATALATEHDFLSLAMNAPLLTEAPAIAEFIATCAGLEVPFRLLGLEGHVFSTDTQLGVLNALGAAVFAYTEDLGPTGIARILRCPDAQAWGLQQGSLEFGDLTATESQIEEARAIVLGVGVHCLDTVSQWERRFAS